MEKEADRNKMNKCASRDTTKFLTFISMVRVCTSDLKRFSLLLLLRTESEIPNLSFIVQFTHFYFPNPHSELNNAIRRLFVQDISILH
jgi:hypothetical protein